MEPERTPTREIGEGYSYVGLGCSFAGGTLMFMAAGWFLDKWLHLTPVLTVAGTLAGAALSFLNVYWKLQADAAQRRRRRRS